jgi:hypothetical protein
MRTSFVSTGTQPHQGAAVCFFKVGRRGPQWCSAVWFCVGFECVLRCAIFPHSALLITDHGHRGIFVTDEETDEDLFD